MSEKKQISHRLPVELLARMDEARGDLTRSAWLNETITKRLDGNSGGVVDLDGLVVKGATVRSEIFYSDGVPTLVRQDIEQDFGPLTAMDGIKGIR